MGGLVSPTLVGLAVGFLVGSCNTSREQVQISTEPDSFWLIIGIVRTAVGFLEGSWVGLLVGSNVGL